MSLRARPLRPPGGQTRSHRQEGWREHSEAIFKATGSRAQKLRTWWNTIWVVCILATDDSQHTPFKIRIKNRWKREEKMQCRESQCKIPKEKRVGSEGEFIIVSHGNWHDAVCRADYTSADANGAHTRVCVRAQKPLLTATDALPGALR